jgi:hypothetical protein
LVATARVERTMGFERRDNMYFRASAALAAHYREHRRLPTLPC